MKRFMLSAAALVLLLTSASPASAADEIGLSLDGTHWGDSVVEPLFDADAVWVPGDTRTVPFFVRNHAETGAELTVDVTADDHDRLWADDHLALRARVEGRWVELRNGVPSAELTAASIGSGEHVRVDLQAAFDPGSGNASQDKALHLVLTVHLAGAIDDVEGPKDGGPNDGGPDGRSDDDPNDHAGWLPSTGSETPMMLMWLAGSAIVVGAALVAAGRREREDEHD